MDVLGLFDLPVWIPCVMALFSLYYFYSTANFGVFLGIGVPGPKPWPIVGNLHEYMKKGFVQAEMGYFKKYGRIFGIYEGRFPILMIAELDMLKDVMVKEFNNFTNRRSLSVGDFPPSSEFLISLKDDKWRHNRNTVTPTFSGGKLKQMNGLICKSADSMVKILEPKAANREPINIQKFTGRFVMNVIASAAFGIDLNIDSSTNEDLFVRNAKQFFDISLFQPALLVEFLMPCLAPVLNYLRIGFIPRDATEFFTKIVNQALEERRKCPGKFNDFLELMIAAGKHTEASEQQEGNSEATGQRQGSDGHGKGGRKGLTDSEILSAAITFFSAGFDTTSSTLSHVLYLLALNPKCRDKLESTIDEHFPENTAPSYETVKDVPYLDMVIMETLRMIPPAGRVDRECKRDIHIRGRFIPAGITVAVPVYVIHHDPDNWSDPDTFDPERFSPENRKTHHPLQWIPFGFGPRNCIGMRLANYVMKMALVRLVQSYRAVANSKTVPLDLGTTLFLGDKKNGVWVTLENRD